MTDSRARNAMVTLMAGLALVFPAWIGLLISGVPTILCPFPTLTTLPAFLLSDWHLWKTAVVLPTLLFFAWHPSLFGGGAKIPKRSYALFGVVTALSIAYFIVSWKWGLKYQGARHVHAVFAINLVWAGVLGLGFVRSWKGTSTFAVSLLLHWMLFAWLAWYAFPYLGELP